MKQVAIVAMTRNGIKRKNGALKTPKRYKKGRIANVPHVPGALGRNPVPKKERKRTSEFPRLGAFSSFIDPSYNAPTLIDRCTSRLLIFYGKTKLFIQISL